MKEFIKDYILSQVTPTTPTNEIQILNQSEQTSENFGYSYVKTENNVVFYANSENGMMFYVYDRYFNLVKQEELTTNHLRIVGETLKADEDGRFYMVGYVTPENSSTEVYALILINDLTKNIAQIRKYYKLSDYGINEQVKYCQKRNGSADYLFVYEKNGTGGYFDLTFIQLTISVQNGNSYTMWQYKNFDYGSNDSIRGIGYQYNLESSKILLVGYGDTDFNSRVTLADINEWNTNGTTYLTKGNGIIIDKMLEIETLDTVTQPKILVNGISSFVFIDNVDLKFVQYNINDNFTNPIKRTITSDTSMKFVINEKYVGYITGSENTYILNLKTYELTENDIKISNNILKIPFDFEYDLYYISRINLINIDTYNLTTLGFVLIEEAGTGVTEIVQTDNSIEEYSSYDSLVPNYVNLYDGNILFSRKLTNESIIGNQMSAEVNVPYLMLNRTISVEKLISKTYKVISDETRTINKNVYESLYLNFIKYINVIDNNFGKSELQNDISSLLVQSIFNKPQQNYNKAPIGYARIFLKNGKNSVISIGQSAITQISQYEYQISIAVNGNNADKIQILAKDKKTPYVTIPLHNVNKVILIKQNFKIEEV